MRILLVSTVLHKGLIGPAKFVRYLYDTADLEVDVLVENEQAGKNIITFSLELGWFARKLSVYSRIKRYQEQLLPIADRYDVILFSSGTLAYGLPELKATVMVMINDDNFMTARLLPKKSALINSFYRRVEKKLVREHKHILVNSKYLKGAVCRDYGISEHKVHVLYKAASQHHEHNRLHNSIQTHQPIKVLFVKTDYQRGGLYELVAALGLLTDFQFELTVVGARPQLDSLPNVDISILGPQTNEQVLGGMLTHHIYCVPSHREALGVANMEAMACGIPVVTTDAGGIPEVITEKEGWIAQPGNVKSLADALRRCITEPDSRAAKVKMALDRVKDFSSDRMIKRLKQIIGDVRSA